jgi:putative transposase
MSCTTSPEHRPAFDRPLAGFLDHPELPFADVLTDQHVGEAFARHSVHFGTAHNSIFTPALTLWAWLAQVVGADKSCAAACARVGVLLLALARPRCSEDTAAYCRSRARLPAAPLQELAEGLADRLEQAVPPAWLWRGRHVQLADGSTVTLADTPENQAAFPQPDSQKKGLGFPMIRLVALVSLATGLVGGLAYGPYQGKHTGETALLRRLRGRAKPGDVVVLDRYYGNYWMVALLLSWGVDVCVRVHHGKKCDFRKGKRLGHLDHLVTWKRPPRPPWLSEEECRQFPKELCLREVGIDLPERGYRSGRVVVATSLVDAAAYANDDIAELYKWRWQVEVDLRHIKTTLQMRQLCCTTPGRVAAELWMHVLGHNLVRKVMAQAALCPRPCQRPSRLRRGAAGAAALTPRQISFKAALVQLREHALALSTATPEHSLQLAKQALTTLAGKRVGQRVGRKEPRAIKRRPRNRPVLNRPRAEVKRRMQEGKTGKASGVSARRRH